MFGGRACLRYASRLVRLVGRRDCPAIQCEKGDASRKAQQRSRVSTKSLRAIKKGAAGYLNAQGEPYGAQTVASMRSDQRRSMPT
jgi:hypothetical protein